MLKRARYLLRIYTRLQLLHIRSHLEYEADFWIGIVGALLLQGAGFIFVWTVFQRVPEIAGWKLWEVALLYGLTIIPRGLAEVLCDGQWRLRLLVNSGEFDRLLVRPLSPALQLITQASAMHGFGSAILGLIIVGKAAGELNLDWGLWQPIFLAATLLNGLLLIGAVNFITNMSVFISFGETNQFPVLVHNTLEFVKFPLTLYGRVVQAVMTWAVPFAFVSYYPGLVLLGRPEARPWHYAAALLSGPIVMLITALLWRVGIKRYQGTGS
jgi:ABC-2 type transport system permease protein